MAQARALANISRKYISAKQGNHSKRSPRHGTCNVAGWISPTWPTRVAGPGFATNRKKEEGVGAIVPFLLPCFVTDQVPGSAHPHTIVILSSGPLPGKGRPEHARPCVTLSRATGLGQARPKRPGEGSLSRPFKPALPKQRCFARPERKGVPWFDGRAQHDTGAAGQSLREHVLSSAAHRADASRRITAARRTPVTLRESTGNR